MSTSSLCPCGSNMPYDKCCERFHHHSAKAPTAEALMRSRYSAFALQKYDYIIATQRLSGQDNPTSAALAQSCQGTEWVSLTINDTSAGLEADQQGAVSFTAQFQEGQHSGELSERSLFEKIDGEWFYVSGEHTVQSNMKHQSALPKIGRNDPCACGSGKKHKKCCG